MWVLLKATPGGREFAFVILQHVKGSGQVIVISPFTAEAETSGVEAFQQAHSLTWAVERNGLIGEKKY
jgi:hypothetical protein